MAGNGDGELVEYKVLMQESPNRPPVMKRLVDLTDRELRNVILSGLRRMHVFKAEVASLYMDLDAANMEAARRGWTDADLEGNTEQEDDVVRAATDMGGEDQGDKADESEAGSSPAEK